MSKIQYRTYEEAELYAHSLNLKNREEWTTYCKSGLLPDDIPKHPASTYKNKGWISLNNFLGTNRCSCKNIRNYEEAKIYVQTLNLKSQTEWLDYAKSGLLPADIPKNPRKVFKDKGWISFGDFIGTGIIAPQNMQFKNYEDAKEYVQTLNLKSQIEWRNYAKSGLLLQDIPKAPDKFYKDKGWISWGAFLDTGTIATQNMQFKNYEDAKEYVQTLKLNNVEEWKKCVKDGLLPTDIPKGAAIYYKDKGWISWGDFLGTGTIATFNIQHKSYKEAELYVHTLNLKNQKEWITYCKSGLLPNDIPKTPDIVYKDKGWTSLGDFLGTGNIAKYIISREIKQEVLDFITKLEPVMKTLSSINLIVIIQAAKNGYFLETLRKNTAFKRLINADTEEQQNKAYEDLYSGLNGDTDTYDEDDFDITEDKTLTSGRRLREMKAIDMVNLSSFMDNEVYIFLQESYINEWMNVYVNDKITFAYFKNEIFEKNGFSDTLRTKLLEKIYNIEHWDYRGSIEGDTYIFPHDLYMEQKVFAYEMYERNSYMNLSLPGAGKTLPCIVVSKLLGVCNTLIITCNATIDTWVKEIKKSFNHNHIVIREDLKGNKKCTFDNSGTKWNYLILNYEYFQQGLNNDILDILNQYHFAAVIIDEIQKAKQTTEKEESIRRKTLLGTLDKIYKMNNSVNYDTKVMSLTGTPVINNLYEAKTLLELALNKKFPEISGKNDVNNAIMIHTQLVNNGIRFKPQYNIDMDINYPIIDGQELVNDLLLIDKKHPTLPIERTILNLKLEATKHLLKKGTLIYCEYIDGLVLPIKEFCEQQGFSVGLFIGDDKAGKDKFVNGQVDILIGSSCINTGIDGLQNVSDNMIVYSLPWTNANWIQLIGRLYRPGQTNKVTITVPMINIETDCQIWSWDKHRVDRINWKKTLADCAVDGNIPSDKIMDRASLERTAINSLIEWKKRIEENGMNSIDRTADEVILEELDEDNRRKFKLGRFSEMNQNWSVSNSDTIQKQLKDNPEDWFEYHELYKEATKNWLEVPVYNIADRIEEGAIVGDFGCGENLLSKKISDKNIIYPFDYIAVDDSVIECDIKNTNLPDETLDVAVICLALMGRNCKDYIKEAYRTLSIGGKLYIAEPASKWKNNEKRLKDIIESCGFKCSDIYKNTDKFIYIDGIK
jgi:superfamily II DNA or RNA helicase